MYTAPTHYFCCWMLREVQILTVLVGLEELEEVNRNISERIQPAENHIVFETNHGVERSALKIFHFFFFFDKNGFLKVDSQTGPIQCQTGWPRRETV